MKRILLALLSVALFATTAQAARIKDVAQVAGVRSNQLVGYGLVSGLPGTGESNPFTEQSFAAMLQNFGIQMPPGTKPKIKNVAAVMVTAELLHFQSRDNKSMSLCPLSVVRKACVVVRYYKRS